MHAIVDAGVDWHRAIRMASVQTVMPLVYRYLTSELEGVLPAAAADMLRGAFFGNSVRNRALACELVRLMALLKAGGVEPLALKGPALAMAAYGDVAMRQFTDLDLLVRKHEAGRVTRDSAERRLRAAARIQPCRPRPARCVRDSDSAGGRTD